ncbi:MAG: hypothetical protein JXQ90_17590 [Cyclobacteriaceae bacterium]
MKLLKLVVIFSLVTLIQCNNADEPVTEEEQSFAVDIGSSTIPYIVINTDEDVVNKPSKSAPRMDQSHLGLTRLVNTNQWSDQSL